jgi:hypothetical protein
VQFNLNYFFVILLKAKVILFYRVWTRAGINSLKIIIEDERLKEANDVNEQQSGFSFEKN